MITIDFNRQKCYNQRDDKRWKYGYSIFKR